MPPKKQGGTPRPAQAGQFLNLERVPTLAPKFANQIGKTCTGFRVLYAPEGMSVGVNSTVSSTGTQLTTPEWVTIPEWERRRALKNTPSADERLSALRRKYELRLNREFPEQGPRSGSEPDIQAWLGALPFAQRVALLKSQKDFERSYPEGFRDPR